MKNFNQGNKLKKAATRLIAKKIPHHEIVVLQDMFRALDVNKCGKISLEQFGKALKKKGQYLTREEIVEMWQVRQFL